MADGLIGNINRIDELLLTGEAIDNQNKVGLKPMHMARQKVFKVTKTDEQYTCSVCIVNTKTGDTCYKLLC